MHKLVDGRRIEVTPAEAAAIEAEQVPAVRPRRRISKTAIRQHLTDTGRIRQAVQAITNDPEIFSRLLLSGPEDLLVDDPNTIALVQAIGLTPEDVLKE